MSSLLDRLTSDRARSQRWIRAHLDYPHADWCLLWPFALNQGGYANFGREGTLVSRLMCEARNGLPPTPQHQAAHSCTRGREGCVNPHHLDWKTNSENQLDRFRDAGRIQPRYKLTPQQVDEIRALGGRARVVDIARQYGVTDTNIHDILNGKTWKIGRRDKRIFKVDEVLSIRAREGVVSIAELAKEYGVSTSVIKRIHLRVTFKWVTDATAFPSTESKTDAP